MTRAAQQPPPPVDGVKLEARQKGKVKDSWVKRFWRVFGWDRLVLVVGALFSVREVNSVYLGYQDREEEMIASPDYGFGVGSISADQMAGLYTQATADMLGSVVACAVSVFAVWMVVRALVAMKAER